MSYQRSREVNTKQSEETGRKRKVPTNKTRHSVFTRSMAATASTTNNGQTVAASDMDGPSIYSEMEVLTKYNNTIINKLKRLQMMLVHRDKKIKFMSEENSYLKLQLTRTEKEVKPMSSTCSSGIMNLEDLSSTKLLKNQIVESKKHTSSQGDNMAFVRSLDPIEPKKKQHKIKNTSTRPRNLGKMREFTVVTNKGGYYTCLGDFDPNEDRDVCQRKRDLELPSWRIKSITMDAADICNETIPQMEYNTKCETNAQMRYYSKCEKYEQKIKRWDVQRARELKQIEYLKEGRYKNSTQTLGNANTEKDMTSLLPNPEGIDMVRVNSNVPVSAFGCNLHIKKKAGLYKFHYSKWCNDGTELPE